MRRVLHRLRSEQSGFTLIELLTAAVVGTVIVAVAFGLLDSTVRAFGSSSSRTDVAQRGRLSMDVVLQKLRSPVCLEVNAPGGGVPNAAFLNATGSSVTFWSDTTGSNFTGPVATSDPPTTANPKPVVRTLTYDQGVLSEEVRSTNGGTVIANRQLATGIQPIGTTPIFSFWRLSDPTTPATPRQASVALTVPVAAADRDRIARMRVSFEQRPDSGDAKNAAEFVNDVYIRSIDTGQARGSNRCIGT